MQWQKPSLRVHTPNGALTTQSRYQRMEKQERDQRELRAGALSASPLGFSANGALREVTNNERDR